MSLKLSHTALDKYRNCPQSYHLHYNKRLREDALNSPLFFGAALDSAINAILKCKLSNTSKTENPYAIFHAKMLYTSLNSQEIGIPSSLNVFYNKGDFDSRLILMDDYLVIKEQFPDFEINVNTINEFIEETRERQKKENISEDERLLFNYINWLCLKRKGFLLIQAYQEQIYPHITKVYSIQEPVSLKNEEGDEVVGFIDFVGDWDGVGPIVFDNKTSSRKYKEDAVHESEQLCLYSEHKEINKAGFCVLIKDIKFDQHKTCKGCGDKTTRKFKTCPTCQGEYDVEFKPRVDTQVLINDLDNKKQDEIFLEIEGITHGIKNKQFPKNLSNCEGYGRKCPYYFYCREGIMDGLVDLNKITVDERSKKR